MANRDFFSRPTQTDRNRPGYGHTKLQPERRPRDPWLRPTIIAALLFAGWALIQIARWH